MPAEQLLDPIRQVLGHLDLGRPLCSLGGRGFERLRVISCSIARSRRDDHAAACSTPKVSFSWSTYLKPYSRVSFASSCSSVRCPGRGLGCGGGAAGSVTAAAVGSGFAVRFLVGPDFCSAALHRLW